MDQSPLLTGEATAIEFHCHGLGNQDFSRFDEIDLDLLDRDAAAEGLTCVPTLYLPYSRLDAFVDWMGMFARIRDRLPHVGGIALEGPLLASFGGTPEQGIWSPTKREWERLAQCGAQGLQYIVLAPDAMTTGSALLPGQSWEHPSLEWIITTLVEHGVRPALGHFHKLDEVGSAACIDEAVEVSHRLVGAPRGGLIVTDHLFNDMPVRVPYAWRGPDAKRRRDNEVAALDLASWTLSSADSVLGPVPGGLLRHAAEHRLIVSINFDGEHVDIDIAIRAAQLAGESSVIAMTDRSDVPVLGGQALTKPLGSTLWYQEGGIVAAGSQHISEIIDRLRNHGVEEDDILKMVALTPARAIGGGM